MTKRETYEKQTEELGKESLENVSMETNKIIGDIEVSSDKFLAFSIPYSAGFRAYVDGKKVDLIKANSMYMGIELKKGKHEIVLTYCTPYIVPGLILTATGLLLFLLIAVSYRKPKKSGERGKQKK